ncbi:hypothetical protein BDV12DRAFT_77414 [Aspergillus spectabilis]
MDQVFPHAAIVATSSLQTSVGRSHALFVIIISLRCIVKTLPNPIICQIITDSDVILLLAAIKPIIELAPSNPCPHERLAGTGRTGVVRNSKLRPHGPFDSIIVCAFEFRWCLSVSGISLHLALSAAMARGPSWHPSLSSDNPIPSIPHTWLAWTRITSAKLDMDVWCAGIQECHWCIATRQGAHRSSTDKNRNNVKPPRCGCWPQFTIFSPGTRGLRMAAHAEFSFSNCAGQE